MKKLSLKTDVYKETFTHDIPFLQNLPIALNPWPKAQIIGIHQNFTTQQVTNIMNWAEKYELFYSLGYMGNHEVYFIPLLSTEFLGDDAYYDWPDEDEEDSWYNKPSITVLYAKLNFSAIDHFFYSVLTEILKDVLNDVQHNLAKNARKSKCYIGYRCQEAILPIRVEEISCDIKVYLKYHLLQNVIEFRTE